MTPSLAVALLALLVALFAVTALVAVYARVKALEAGTGPAALSGYAALVGRPAPPAVAPRAGERMSVVAVLDTSCATCLSLWDTLNDVAAELADSAPGARYVGLVDHRTDLAGAATGPHAELLADTTVRADLFEGYAPTLLAVDAGGTVFHRSFVYPDTDVRALLLDLVKGHRS